MEKEVYLLQHPHCQLWRDITLGNQFIESVCQCCSDSARQLVLLVLFVFEGEFQSPGASMEEDE